jgi:NitT/TauT family transport system substrate-binding protein
MVMNKRPRSLLFRIAMLVAVLGVVAYAGTGAAGTRSAKLTTIHFRTGFGIGTWDAGFYVAQYEGYYRRAGLNVVLQAGLGSFSNVTLVAAGQADIVHAASPAVMQAVARGAQIKMIASFIQNEGDGVYTQPSITSVHQFCGHTWVGYNFDVTSTLFPYYMKAIGLDPNCVHQHISTLGNTVKEMAAGTDMAAGLGWSDHGSLEAEGIKFHFFPYAQAGMKFVGPGLVVSDKWISDPNNLKAATAFAEASAAGWVWAMQHPKAAATIAEQVEPTLVQKDTEATVRVFPAWNHTPRTLGGAFGRMDPGDWQDSVNNGVKFGLIKSAIDPTTLYQNVIPANFKLRFQKTYALPGK